MGDQSGSEDAAKCLVSCLCGEEIDAEIAPMLDTIPLGSVSKGRLIGGSLAIRVGSK